MPYLKILNEQLIVFVAKLSSYLNLQSLLISK